MEMWQFQDKSTFMPKALPLAQDSIPGKKEGEEALFFPPNSLHLLVTR